MNRRVVETWASALEEQLIRPTATSVIATLQQWEERVSNEMVIVDFDGHKYSIRDAQRRFDPWGVLCTIFQYEVWLNAIVASGYPEPPIWEWRWTGGGKQYFCKKYGKFAQWKAHWPPVEVIDWVRIPTDVNDRLHELWASGASFQDFAAALRKLL